MWTKAPTQKNADAVRDAVHDFSVCTTLTFVLAIPRAAKAHRWVRSLMQEKWAEMMDRHDSPLEK